MPTRATTKSTNGAWLKAGLALGVAVILGTAGVLWGLNGRVTRAESDIGGLKAMQTEMRADIKELLRRVPER